MSDWNFEDESKTARNTLVVIWSVCIIVAFILLFSGCVNNFKPINQKNYNLLQCVDGHLYEVSPQKVEMVLQDSCDTGKIEMKGE